MEIFVNKSGNINFTPFKDEQDDPGIKTHNKFSAFFREIAAFLGIGSGVVAMRPDGKGKLYLNKEEAIEWLNRHLDPDKKKSPIKEIKSSQLLTNIQAIYDSKLTQIAAKKTGTTPGMTPSVTAKLETIKGGFPNVGMTSYLSIAMHHINAVLRTLPPPPITQDNIKQVAGEPQADFEKRKQAATQVLQMLKTINSGQNCTPAAMANLNKLLNQINPDVIPNLATSTGGNSMHAFKLLCKLFFPNDEIFFGGKRWYEETLNEIPPMGTDPNKNAKQVFGSSPPFSGIGGIPEVLTSNTCAVRYEFPNKIESFPHFFTFDIHMANMNYTKDFPETFELSVKDGSIPNAKYELTGMTITGPAHCYLEKVNGKWVQYESTAIIKEISAAEKVHLTIDRDSENNTAMPFYKRVS